jgi:hypothetical protein
MLAMSPHGGSNVPVDAALIAAALDFRRRTMTALSAASS